MSIVDEINKDLEKMGGDTSGHTVEEAMDKFGDQIIKEIGDATELPEVTAEDEGNVLMVDSEGKWAKGEIPKELPAVRSADKGKTVLVDKDGEWAKNYPVDKLKIAISGTQAWISDFNGESVTNADLIKYVYNYAKSSVFNSRNIIAYVDFIGFNKYMSAPAYVYSMSESDTKLTISGVTSDGKLLVLEVTSSATTIVTNATITTES